MNFYYTPTISLFKQQNISNYIDRKKNTRNNQLLFSYVEINC